jgi:hypothetical protein
MIIVRVKPSRRAGMSAGIAGTCVSHWHVHVQHGMVGIRKKYMGRLHGDSV